MKKCLFLILIQFVYNLAFANNCDGVLFRIDPSSINNLQIYPQLTQLIEGTQLANDQNYPDKTIAGHFAAGNDGTQAQLVIAKRGLDYNQISTENSIVIRLNQDACSWFIRENPTPTLINAGPIPFDKNVSFTVQKADYSSGLPGLVIVKGNIVTQKTKM